MVRYYKIMDPKLKYATFGTYPGKRMRPIMFWMILKSSEQSVAEKVSGPFLDWLKSYESHSLGNTGESYKEQLPAIQSFLKLILPQKDVPKVGQNPKMSHYIMTCDVIGHDITIHSDIINERAWSIL